MKRDNNILQSNLHAYEIIATITINIRWRGALSIHIAREALNSVIIASSCLVLII